MCSFCRLPVAKHHNFGQISTFWGLLYRPPFTDEGQMWCTIADPWYTLTCQISSRSVYSVASVAEKTQFLPFFGLRHLVLSSIGTSLTKLNMGAQLQTFPYPTASKSFLYCNAFIAKSGAQSLTFKSVTNKQTNRHTNKKINVFGHPGGGLNPSPTKHGMVIEDLEQVLAPRKLSFAARGC